MSWRLVEGYWGDRSDVCETWRGAHSSGHVCHVLLLYSGRIEYTVGDEWVRCSPELTVGTCLRMCARAADVRYGT